MRFEATSAVSAVMVHEQATPNEMSSPVYNSVILEVYQYSYSYSYTGSPG